MTLSMDDPYEITLIKFDNAEYEYLVTRTTKHVKATNISPLGAFQTKKQAEDFIHDHLANILKNS